MNIPKQARLSILVLAICVFAFSTYKVTIYYLDEQKNNQHNRELRNVYYQGKAVEKDKTEPSTGSIEGNEQGKLQSVTQSVYSSKVDVRTPNILRVQERFSPLLKENSGLVGWIKIEGTAIDYPVVQAQDNDFYLTRDFAKKQNVNGSIFMDFRNRLDDTEKHTVLYGHNMKNETMFYDLLNYESQWYFNNRSIIEFDTLYANQKWKIFSAYFTDVKDDYIRTEFKSKEDYKLFLEEIHAKSLHKSDVVVNENDTILTLSTCAGITDDTRITVHAKLIQ